MEIRVCNFDTHLDTISQTIDNNVGPREVSWWGWQCWYGYASGFGVSGETGDTLAVTNMVDGYSGCSKCIGSARIPYARIGTGLVSSFTIFDDLAVWIFTALRNFDTNSIFIEFVSRWANTTSD